jgi:hypothetical protein
MALLSKEEVDYRYLGLSSARRHFIGLPTQDFVGKAFLLLSEKSPPFLRTSSLRFHCAHVEVAIFVAIELRNRFKCRSRGHPPCQYAPLFNSEVDPGFASARCCIRCHSRRGG